MFLNLPFINYSWQIDTCFPHGRTFLVKLKKKKVFQEGGILLYISFHCDCAFKKKKLGIIIIKKTFCSLVTLACWQKNNNFNLMFLVQMRFYWWISAKLLQETFTNRKECIPSSIIDPISSVFSLLPSYLTASPFLFNTHSF